MIDGYCSTLSFFTFCLFFPFFRNGIALHKGV